MNNSERKHQPSQKKSKGAVGFIIGPFIVIALLYLFVQVRDTYTFIQQSTPVVGTIEKWDPIHVNSESADYVYIAHVRFTQADGKSLSLKMVSDFEADYDELVPDEAPELPDIGTSVNILYNPEKSPPVIVLNHWKTVWKGPLKAVLLFIAILVVAFGLRLLDTKSSTGSYEKTQV